MTISPIIVFCIAQLWIAGIMIPQIWKSYEKARILREQLHAHDLSLGFNVRLRLLFDPKSAVSPHDPPAINAAKDDYVKVLIAGRRTLLTAVIIEVLGFVALILVALVESWMRRSWNGGTL